MIIAKHEIAIILSNSWNPNPQTATQPSILQKQEYHKREHLVLTAKSLFVAIY